SWRSAQVFGLTIGIRYGLVAALVVGLGAGFIVAYPAELLVGLTVSLMIAFTFAETTRASFAFFLLRRHRHTPIRLLHFLEDARKRGIMRTVGPTYQFRHARLQDRLAVSASGLVKIEPDKRLGPTSKAH